MTILVMTLFVMVGPDAPGGSRDNGAEYCRSIDPDYHIVKRVVFP